MESSNPKIIQLQKKLMELRETLCKQTIERGNAMTGFFNQLEEFIKNVMKIVDGTNWGDINRIVLLDFIQIGFVCPKGDTTVHTVPKFGYYFLLIELEKFGNFMKVNNPLFRKDMTIELKFESPNKKQIILSFGNTNEKPIQYENLSNTDYQTVKLVLDQIFDMKDVLYTQLLERVIAWYHNRLT